MKKVLFLAPNFKYICTTVNGVTKALDRAHVKYTTNVNDETFLNGSTPYLKTDGIEVIFNYDDPVRWTGAMLSNVSAVYGQKDLVKRCQDRFYTNRAILYRTGSLEKVVTTATHDEEDPTVFNDFPQKTQYIPEIKNVYFNNPMTVVIWNDGTKTLVKCQGDDIYNKEVGLALCISKKALGNQSNFNNVFHKWINKEETTND